MLSHDTKIQVANNQKHLGLNLDSKLGFNKHRDNKINKCNKIIGIIKILSLILSFSVLRNYSRSYFQLLLAIYSNWVWFLNDFFGKVLICKDIESRYGRFPGLLPNIGKQSPSWVIAFGQSHVISQWWSYQYSTNQSDLGWCFWVFVSEFGDCFSWGHRVFSKSRDKQHIGVSHLSLFANLVTMAITEREL